MGALTKGPWIILGHHLTVQQWTPDFDSIVTNFEHVNVWIRLPGLTLQRYHKKTLHKLGQVVREVIKLDDNNESSIRGKFTRLAIRISLAKPLVFQIELNGRVQKIEYEGLPVIYFKCGRYGQNSRDYSEATKDGQLGGEESSGKDK